MKAMILAAGIGKRLRPLTDTIPKPLIPINGKPLIEYVVDQLKLYGVAQIVVNVHHHSQKMIQFFKDNNNFGLEVEFSDESQQLMNTGGGIVKAKHFFSKKEPFLVYASDVITNLNLDKMLAFHKENKSLVTLAVKDRETTRSLIFNSEMQLCGWRDNISGEEIQCRSIDNEISLGFSCAHIIEPELFDLVTEQGAFNITDMYLRLASKHTIKGFRHDNDYWLEFGRYENIESTAKQLKEIS